VLSLVPVFGVLLVRNEKVFARSSSRAPTPASEALRNFCYWIAVRMVSRPGLFSLIAVLVVGGLASSTPISSRAIGSPTRCRTSSRRWRQAAGSTPSSPAPIRSTC
jgi:hypothetical protein